MSQSYCQHDLQVIKTIIEINNKVVPDLEKYRQKIKMSIFIFLLLYMDLIRASAGKLKVLMGMLSNLKQMRKIFGLFCSKFTIEVT